MLRAIISVSEWILSLIIMIGFATKNEAIVLIGVILISTIAITCRKAVIEAWIYLSIYGAYILVIGHEL